MHRRFLVTALAVALAGTAVAVNACSNQSEGDRCDTRGDNLGTDDCGPGLKCYEAATLASHPASDVCCPQDRTNATGVCSEFGTPIDATSPAVDSATSDTGADVSADVNSDANDAATDANDGATDANDGATNDSGADAATDAPADG